jgi:hypothetical protein
MFKSKRKILTTYKGFCNSFCTVQNSAVPAVTDLPQRLKLKAVSWQPGTAGVAIGFT